MQTTRLGTSGIEASRICLGTMTWGSQTSEAEAHGQLDLARDRGVSFLDTAEMYPTNPVRFETIGRTEEVIGSWFARTGRRDEWVLATKVGGEGGSSRDGEPITGDVVRRVVEDSLRRLRTDRIDLLQFHWPNRGSYHFRKLWSYDPSGQDRAATLANMADCLEALGALRAAGKIRAFGLSNETAWGMAQWLRLAEAGLGPRAASIQNEYSLLCRHYDTDLAELSVNEEVTLLAYSPLATGLLTGKYAGDVIPEGSRRAINPDLGGRITPRVWEAVAAYLGIAVRARLDPATMAVAWVLSRPFPVIPIVGATSPGQLGRALDAAELTLGADVLAAVAEAHKAHPMPF